MADTPSFIERETDISKPPRCVDGRPDYTLEDKGPQMLGGSLHPIVIQALFSGTPITREFVQESLGVLGKNGFGTGVHRGSHRDTERHASDCGFADKLYIILKKAVEEKEEIGKRLSQTAETYPGAVSDEVVTALDDAFGRIARFERGEDALFGEGLVACAEGAGASVEKLEGDHKERVAFVNMKPGVTLDTNGLNKKGQQAFNLDIWAAIQQAEVLGVDPSFATAASLALYQATEMVLVEDSGKAPLRVEIHQ